MDHIQAALTVEGTPLLLEPMPAGGVAAVIKVCACRVGAGD